MEYRLSTRKTVRLVSFTLAVCLMLGGIAYTGFAKADYYQMQLEYNYQRALDDLSDHISNLETALLKGRYAATPPQQQGIAAKLQQESSGAKASLAQLPLSSVPLDELQRFLAQVGDFSSSLASQLARGEKLSDEQMQQLSELGKYASSLNYDIKDLQARYDDGQSPLGEAVAAMGNLPNEGESPLTGLQSGFRDMNEGFTDYPTLIYDGPFSDHILQRTSKMLEGQNTATQQEALSAAAEFLRLPEETLAFQEKTEGNLPLYCFSGENLSIAVTQAGGYVDYYLNSRVIGEAKLSAEEAVDTAKDYLAARGFDSMKESYYTTAGNICTINFAWQQDGVTYYSDLIKVSVALDDGEIVGFGASGYLMNHISRGLPAEQLSMEEAKAVLSPYLTVQSEGRAVIPTAGLNEVSCYEFFCESDTGDRLLVYINVETGMEEQILLLLQSDGGTLVM